MGEKIIKHSASKIRRQMKGCSFQKVKNCVLKIGLKESQKFGN